MPLIEEETTLTLEILSSKVRQEDTILYSEEEFEENNCSLTLHMFRKGVHTTTSCDANSGLKRLLRISGWIDDSSDNDSRFHNKLVQVEVSAPPIPDRFDRFLNGIPSDKACGVVQIEADIKPKRFEFEGEIVELDPISVYLEVRTDSFEVLSRQVVNADEQHLSMGMNIILVGGALPQKQKSEYPRIYLMDLDINYNTRSTNHTHGRVRPLEREGEEAYGTMISILLVGIRDEVSIDGNISHRISCKGRIVGSSASYDGADVDIEFCEHKQKRWGELPVKASFGEFRFWPKQADGYPDHYFFSLDLKHSSEDIPNLLRPLLVHDVHTQIFLNVSLIIEKKELIEATDELCGNVRYYNFDVRRELINKA